MIIEPLVINLLNEQPDDVLDGIEQWLTTQFNETETEDSNSENN